MLRRILRLLALLLVLLAGFVGWKWTVARLAATPPKDVELQTAIVFGQGGGHDLKLDFTRPRTSAGRMPALLCIHGGGWTGGKKEDVSPFMFQFSKAGIFCATAEYRLTPKDRFPAQIEDVKCAVRWLRANADRYQIDPTRIAVFGISAGAHLASLLAITAGNANFEGRGGNAAQSSAVCAALCLAGPYDLELGYRHSGNQPRKEGEAVRYLLPALLGGTPDEMPEIYRRASPITYVSRETPPMLLVHGEADSLVPIEQAEVFARKLEAAGADVQFLRLPEGTHTSLGKDAEKTFRAIVDFARRQLEIGTPQP